MTTPHNSEAPGTEGGSGGPGADRARRGRPRRSGGPGVMPAPRPSPEDQVTPLYTEEFAADPYAVYERLRAFGPLAPVEIAPGVGGMLVTDYRAALDLLHDSVTWSKDPRPWQETTPTDSQVMGMLRWRPNPLSNDGDMHRRYRQSIIDSFDRLPPHELRDRVLEVADALISQFGTDGRADLMAQYATRLPLMLFMALFGMSDAESARMARAAGTMIEGTDREAVRESTVEYERAIAELVASKKEQPGADLASWLMDHPLDLTDDEVAYQIVLLLGAGLEPTTNLIGNALARMLTDERYYSTLSAGALTPRDAIADVLQNDPPMANFSAHFPRRDVFFHGMWLRQGQLVLVSYAACNAQSGRTPPGQSGGAGASGGGAHLAWAAGPHTCPVRRSALLIATTAIERLTAWLSDIELTVEHDRLQWRSGPFHRALAELPARFSPLSPDQAGAMPWTSSRKPSS